MHLSSWFLSLSVTLTFLYFLRLYTQKSSTKTNLPPGPTPLPIVGSLFLLGDKPHRSLALLAKTHGPIMTLKLGLTTTIVVSSPSAAKEVLQTKDQSLSFRSIPAALQVLGHHELSVIWMPSTSDLWKNLRSLIKSHLFNPQRLDANRGLWQNKLHKLVSHVRRHEGQTLEVGRAAFGTSLNLVSSMLFSEDVVDLDSDYGREFKGLVWGLMEEGGKPNLSDFFPLLSLIDPHGNRRRSAAHLKKLYQFFDKIIDRRLQGRRKENDCSIKSQDLLDELLQLGTDKRTIKSLFADLFVAGSDTNSGTVEWALAELLRNPTSMAKAIAELATVIGRGRVVEESDISRLPFLQAVVKENFRLHPPAPLLLPHRAEADVELAGFTVPKNSQVMVNIWAIGHDSDVWKDPDVFNPERFLNKGVNFQGRHFELIPFGSGRRMCPGMSLAQGMVHLMLATLINSFDWKLPDGMEAKDVDLTEKFGVTLALLTPLQAIPMPIID